MTAPYPKTRQDNISDNIFGVDVHDPYRWLEKIDDPEVKSWMAAQDGVARQYLRELPGRPALLKRYQELYYLDSISVPTHRGGRLFYSRTHADKEKSIHYWRDDKGAEQVLLDPNHMNAHGTTSVGVVEPSYNGKKVAYTLKENNSDEATLYVKEVASGKVFDRDRIAGAKYAQPSWTPKGEGFYYTWIPPVGAVPVADRPGYAEVRFHKLGTDPQADKTIFPATSNPQSFVEPYLSRDGHWLFISIQHGWLTSDLYFRRSDAKEFTPLYLGNDAQYDVYAWKDHFYIRTNSGAPNWKLLELDPSTRAEKLLVAEEKSAVLDGVQVVGGHLALHYLKNASSEVQIHKLDGALVRRVNLPSIGAVTAGSGNPDEDTAYYAFNSLLRPQEIYRVSIATGKTEEWAKVKVPIDPAPYVLEQVWYPSKDGTKISMFLVHRKDLPKNGTTPFLLTGYGGFNVAMQPSFAAGIYPWLEAGGGFALPNLRGGGEYGESWHRAGMKEHKQNVFDDFIAAAEFLIREGYSKPEKLGIRGGSNGGLLMGVAVTQRPELFGAVLCAVPLLDMVRYHLFGSGKTWIPEYGFAENEAQFRTLLAYSPYHHVMAERKLPAFLMLSADADDRVDPLHARKMVAALQAAYPSGRPIVLRIEQHAGHGGADRVQQTVEQQADSYAFLMHELNVAFHR